jgi:DNA-binding IclR family transcriptional regulator
MLTHEVKEKALPQAGEGSVQSVTRALSLLKIIASERNPASLAILIKRSGLNRTTVWRLLSTLEHEGFVVRLPSSKSYALGYSAMQLCHHSRQQYEPLIRICRPFLERIREDTNETSLLSVPYNDMLLCVDQVNSHQVIRLKNYINSLSPLYCTSNGKLYLGYLEEDELFTMVSENLPQLTEYTITNRDELIQEVKRSYQQGYGVTESEYNTSENAISCALEQNGQPIAFITVSGPSFRFSRGSMIRYAPKLLQLRDDIQNMLNDFLQVSI